MDGRTVLLVADDDSSYCLLIEFALKKAQIDAKTIYVSDGEEVIDYLQDVGRYADRSTHPLPDCIMLDVKMPGMSGLETLVWIRQQPRFKDLPILMLTASRDPDDVRRADDCGANYYLVKPFTCDELARSLREFFDMAKEGVQNQPAGAMRTRL